jgi:hypothetical protein
MAHTTPSSVPKGLFDRLNARVATTKAAVGTAKADLGVPKAAVTIEDLRAAAQLAVQVEFTTIPIYLTGLYSIAETDSFAYQTLRSVVMEEMYHVNQAANILVGLGGTPKFTGSFTPTYPGYLPRANPNTTPYLVLNRASKEVFGQVFAGIETPAAHGAPAQGDNYDSIAQLYDALQAGIEAFEGNPFTNDGPGVQRTDIYLGKFGGTVIEVTDKDSAYAAINEIVKQGEGTVPPTNPLVPVQAYGAYNHYGQRTDGTYGPILGTPYELSHFMKFRKVAMDTAPFPATYPIVSNPSVTDFSNGAAQNLVTLFNENYGVLLRALEATFDPSLSADPADAYFGTAMNMMHEVLPNLARALMTTPTTASGSSNVGPNAAPTWTYQEPIDLEALKLHVEDSITATLTDQGNLSITARDTITACLRQARAGLDRTARGGEGIRHGHS